MYLDQMEVRYSHIFREGNGPAETLSNVALGNLDITWWVVLFLRFPLKVVNDMFSEVILFC